jgi:hypothetical protein
MAKSYNQLLVYAFQRFSVLSATRTALPTLRHFLTRTPLPTSDKPALFTMNICPPVMTVWHHVTRKALGNDVDIVIFDCSGKLQPKDFPGTRIQKFLNPRHALKCDEFLHHIARTRPMSMVCDDDVFIIKGTAMDIIRREMAVPGTACVSFHPRTWWHYDIEGKSYEPAGTHCIALDEKVALAEKLSFAPKNGNPHPSHLGKPVPQYDSFDFANEQLLKKGYRCAIVPEEERSKHVVLFTGISPANMLLNYFSRPQQMLDYLLTPPKKQWRGNILPGVLNGLLTISLIQECHEKITGKRYPLRALPDAQTLEGIRREHEQYLREGESFNWIDEAGERLKGAI